MNSLLLLMLVLSITGLLMFAAVAYLGSQATDWLVRKLQRL